MIKFFIYVNLTILLIGLRSTEAVAISQALLKLLKENNLCPCDASSSSSSSMEESYEEIDDLSSFNSLEGTTENFRDIFIGRCYNYIEVVQLDNEQFNASKYNCVEIFNEFKRVNVGRNPCDIKVDDYSRFLSLTNEYIAPNTTLLWSGTFTQAQDCNF